MNPYGYFRFKPYHVLKEYAFFDCLHRLICCTTVVVQEDEFIASRLKSTQMMLPVLDRTLGSPFPKLALDMKILAHLLCFIHHKLIWLLYFMDYRNWEARVLWGQHMLVKKKSKGIGTLRVQLFQVQIFFLSRIFWLWYAMCIEVLEHLPSHTVLKEECTVDPPSKCHELHSNCVFCGRISYWNLMFLRPRKWRFHAQNIIYPFLYATLPTDQNSCVYSWKEHRKMKDTQRITVVPWGLGEGENMVKAMWYGIW